MQPLQKLNLQQQLPQLLATAQEEVVAKTVP
jgi:hypothetical protein